MSCNCYKISKDRQNHDNIKRLAKAWANFNQTLVVVFRRPDGSYGFADAEIQEAYEPQNEIVEFISHLQ